MEIWCQSVCQLTWRIHILFAKGKQRETEFIYFFFKLLHDFIIDRYISRRYSQTSSKKQKIWINFYSFNYTSCRLINSMSWHQYVQSETFISRDTFFRARRPCFEIQCRLVEAAAVIWTAETIWVLHWVCVALQSIYLHVKASTTSSLLNSSLILFVQRGCMIHFTKLNHFYLSTCCIILYMFKGKALLLCCFGTFGTFERFYFISTLTWSYLKIKLLVNQ